MGLISPAKTDFSRLRAILVGTFILLSASSGFASPVAVPIPSAEAVEYHQVSNTVWGINQFLAFILLPLVFLVLSSRTRVSARLKDGKYWTLFILATLFFTVDRVIRLPLDRLRVNNLNRIENEAGLPLVQWIFSQFLQALPAVILSGSVALLVFWLINKSPSKWWLWATGVFSLLFLALLVFEPYTISNKTLGQSPIEMKIFEIAEQIGIPPASIALEDCEPFESCEIAHVAGLGPTRLILLNKGLFDAYPETWTLQTFAHESKHYVKDDNVVGWIVLTLIILVFLFFLDRVCKLIIKGFSKPLRFTSIGQAAAFPLMILVLNLMYLVSLPPINIFRQHVEFEADRYGLELTHRDEDFAKMVSSWTVGSKHHVPDPSPFFMLFRSSHPSDATRIAYANEFQPKGQNE